MAEVLVPKWGSSMTEATVVRWHKAVGDTVEAGEPLVDLETDKVEATVDAPPPASSPRSMARRTTCCRSGHSSPSSKRADDDGEVRRQDDGGHGRWLGHRQGDGDPAGGRRRGVAVWDLDASSARATAESLDGIACGCNVNDPGSVVEAARHRGAVRRRERPRERGGIFIVEGSVESCSIEDWDRVLGVNLRGVFLVSKALLPAIRRTAGSIVNIRRSTGSGATSMRRPTTLRRVPS